MYCQFAIVGNLRQSLPMSWFPPKDVMFARKAHRGFNRLTTVYAHCSFIELVTLCEGRVFFNAQPLKEVS